MRKYIGQRVIKTALGAPIAIYIAQALGLSQIFSAGVIVILSIQNTKRDSVKIAFKRLKAVTLGLAIASLLFNFLSHDYYMFGVFLFFFIPLCVKYKIGDGIVVSSVLVTHLLAESTVTTSLIVNEFLLFFIGAGVALFINLYMPSVEGKIKEEVILIEGKMKNILLDMSKILRGEEKLKELREEIESLEELLKRGRERAVVNYNNYFFINSSYYTKYMDMRTLQINTIKGMLYNFERIYKVLNQSIILADFTEKVSLEFGEKNDCRELLNELYGLRKSFKEMELPKTREEFETRALLFRYLGDLEHFIKLKRDFIFIENGEN